MKPGRQVTSPNALYKWVVGLGFVPWTDPGVSVLSVIPDSRKSGQGRGLRYFLWNYPLLCFISLHYSLH